jgi:hypothetical protein
MGFTDVEQKILNRYFFKSKESEELLDSLRTIRKAMVLVWAADAPKVIKNYTDHGEGHCERIARRVEELLRNNEGAKFSEQEIYLLLAGIFLHDIGMQCDIVKYPTVKKIAEEKYNAKFDNAKFVVKFDAKNVDNYSIEIQEEIRKNHHLLTAAWIDYLYGMKGKNNSSNTILHEAIQHIPHYLVDSLINVCKFHSKLPITEYPKPLRNDPNKHKKTIAALLRFADELDIDRSRCDKDTVEIFKHNPSNGVYWYLHYQTEVVFNPPVEICITIKLDPEDFKIYGNYIKEKCIDNLEKKNKSVLNALVVPH